MRRHSFFHQGLLISTYAKALGKCILCMPSLGVTWLTQVTHSICTLALTVTTNLSGKLSFCSSPMQGFAFILSSFILLLMQSRLMLGSNYSVVSPLVEVQIFFLSCLGLVKNLVVTNFSPGISGFPDSLSHC